MQLKQGYQTTSIGAMVPQPFSIPGQFGRETRTRHRKYLAGFVGIPGQTLRHEPRACHNGFLFGWLGAIIAAQAGIFQTIGLPRRTPLAASDLPGIY
jgi:hypothetical protein